MFCLPTCLMEREVFLFCGKVVVQFWMLQIDKRLDHLFNKYTPSAYYVPETVLSTG